MSKVYTAKYNRSCFRIQNGQSMVEFVLAIPFLLLAIVSIIYFGKLFYVKQIIVYAAQEGARTAARLPNLSDPSVRDSIRGFTVDGSVVGADDASSNPSPIYQALSAAKMLSGSDGAHGNLPPGASVQILPWDNAASSTTDTVTVVIQYPFGLMVSSQSGIGPDDFGNSVGVYTGGSGNNALAFTNMTLSESASAAQEIYQQ